MATNKKAQGLPITTIILVVIGLLVLFVIIAFFTGAFGKAGTNIRAAGGNTYDVQLSNAQTKCAQWCLQMQGLSTDTAKQVAAYCKNTQFLDGNLNGVVDANEDKNKCSAVPISYACEGAPAQNC